MWRYHYYDFPPNRKRLAFLLSCYKEKKKVCYIITPTKQWGVLLNSGLGGAPTFMKFTLLTAFKDEDRKRIQNKKVCDVVEFIVPSDLGYYKGWIGSTENEYFSVAFVKGVLSVSLEEREMRVGWDITNVAMVSYLHDLLTTKKMDVSTINHIVDVYNKESCENDIKSVKFTDIMKVLDWKFKSRKVKVDIHFLNPY